MGNDMAAARRQQVNCQQTLEFIKNFSQLHPFEDCNTRTFCMLLLNHLLMKNGFPPAILDDPNRFEFYSINEILHEVIQGMENTMALLQKGALYNIKQNLYYLIYGASLVLILSINIL
jgi:hypothetical protein